MNNFVKIIHFTILSIFIVSALATSFDNPSGNNYQRSVNRSNYSKPCKSEDDCPHANEICSKEGKCDCRPSTIYQEETASCVGHHIENPINITKYNCELGDPDQSCVFNAGCTAISYNNTDLEGYCSCTPNFAPDDSKACVRTRPGQLYGATCNEVFLCSDNQHLKCDTNTHKCICKYSKDIYDASSQKCRNSAGGFCNTNTDGEDGFHRECQKDNATCNYFPGFNKYGTCGCNENFCSDGYGRCSLEACTGGNTTTTTTTKIYPTELWSSTTDENVSDRPEPTTTTKGSSGADYLIIHKLLFISIYSVCIWFSLK